MIRKLSANISLLVWNEKKIGYNKIEVTVPLGKYFVSVAQKAKTR